MLNGKGNYTNRDGFDPSGVELKAGPQSSVLPHISNIQAGKLGNRYDPVHRSIFEVKFTYPDGIKKLENDGNHSCVVLRQQVTNVSGLDALQKTTAAGSQKFYGVDVSYLNPVLDNTYAEIEMTLNLNLDNENDNYVLKVFYEWAKLSYDKMTGIRGIKADYISDGMTIAEANRNGDVWRAYQFNNVMLTEITGLNDLDYMNSEAAQLHIKFRSDYWDDSLDFAKTQQNRYTNYPYGGE